MDDGVGGWTDLHGVIDTHSLGRQLDEGLSIAQTFPCLQVAAQSKLNWVETDDVRMVGNRPHRIVHHWHSDRTAFIPEDWQFIHFDVVDRGIVPKGLLQIGLGPIGLGALLAEFLVTIVKPTASIKTNPNR